MQTRLLYVADPMCSWCFAYSAVLDNVRRDLHSDIGIRLVMGGLAPDDDEPMSAIAQQYVQKAWRTIEARTETRFDWTYWDKCQPRRSTWPACRAVLAAGERAPEMYAAIQEAYYHEARDPSDRAVLVEIAAQLGFEPSAFALAIDAPETHALLQADFELRDRLEARAFPSVGLERDGEFELLSRGWSDEADLREVLIRKELLA